jgi:cytosine/adenosine deaminase-related metal-dependent hydrolase
VVVIDGERVIGINNRDSIPAGKLEYFKGIIVPGFINTHCHLELSHLHGKAPTGTGLLPFLQHVVNYRDIDQQVIDQAIAKADADMWTNGIQAVGDICNKTDTYAVKRQSKIAYYSFVEMFDFQQESLSDKLISGSMDAFEQAPEPKAAVPHAPYSVSQGLFQKINSLNTSIKTVSIHNQETQAEEDMFQNGNGAFINFFQGFGFKLDHFQPIGKSSIHYALSGMDPAHRTLFVHNTLTSLEDIYAAQAWSENVYWVTCPNANLYIENRLPDYSAFLDAGSCMTIGTDSLTSNWQLSVLEEMKTIARYQSYVPFETLLQWATYNGAKALGMDEKLGTIEAGKEPGLLALSFNPGEDELFAAHVQVKRLV